MQLARLEQLEHLVLRVTRDRQVIPEDLVLPVPQVPLEVPGLSVRRVLPGVLEPAVRLDLRVRLVLLDRLDPPVPRVLPETLETRVLPACLALPELRVQPERLVRPVLLEIPDLRGSQVGPEQLVRKVSPEAQAFSETLGLPEVKDLLVSPVILVYKDLRARLDQLALLDVLEHLELPEIRGRLVRVDLLELQALQVLEEREALQDHLERPELPVLLGSAVLRGLVVVLVSEVQLDCLAWWEIPDQWGLKVPRELQMAYLEIKQVSGMYE